MGVEEERQTRSEVVDVESGGHSGFDIREAVGQRERQFLCSVRAGFTDVVTRDRDRMPLRHLGRRELHHVGDDPHRGPRREDVFLLRLVFLEDVVLDRAGEL